MTLWVQLRACVVASGLVWQIGCTGPAHVDQYPNQQRMLGKSMASVLSCAGSPARREGRAEAVLLFYYREAPILEESYPVGKGSFATIRHGCWATVLVTGDRVTDVNYRFVPPAFDASNDCEAIFEPCLQ